MEILLILVVILYKRMWKFQYNVKHFGLENGGVGVSDRVFIGNNRVNNIPLNFKWKFDMLS